MANRERPIPVKLKHDAIVEAVVEFRFDMRPDVVPEIFFGRLADYPAWKDLQQRSLPASQIPAPVRRADPNLRYQPVIELAATDKTRSIRIGPNVLSYHCLRPYIGWAKFQPQLTEAVTALFSKSGGLSISRLGLRYMNALQGKLHHITSFPALDLKLSIASEVITSSVNVNVTTEINADTDCMVRVATPNFVQGPGDLPDDMTVFIDVDVFTKSTFKTNDAAKVLAWIELAHASEKKQFFRFLKDETIDLLEEK